MDKPIMANPLLLHQSLKQLARVFTEWERRYREEPERFSSEAVRLLRETPKSYGEACAPYFIQILFEISAPKKRKKAKAK